MSGTANTTRLSAIVDELVEILPEIRAAVAAAADDAAADEALWQARTAYEAAHLKAEQALEAVAGLTDGALVEEDLAVIRARHLEAADALASATPPDFAKAMPLVEAVPAACAVPRAIVLAHTAYLAALEEAKTRIKTLADPAIAKDRADIERDLIGVAETDAAGRHYDTAMVALAKVAESCRVASAAATTMAALTIDVGAAGVEVGKLGDPAVADEKAAGERDLLAAEKAIVARSFDVARKLIGDALKACADAKVVLLRHAEFAKTLAAAKLLVGELQDPVVATEKADISKDLIAPAELEAAKRGFDAADVLLAQVAAKVELGKGIVVKSEAWKKALKALEDRIALITAPVVAPEIVLIGTSFVAPAKLLVAARPYDFDGATAKIGPAARACDVAELHARRYAAALAASEPAFISFKQTAATWQPNSGWESWGAVPIFGVTDVLADIALANIAHGKGLAAAGDYAGAVAALELSTKRVATVRTALVPFRTWNTRIEKAILAHDAARGATGFAAAETAYDTLRTDTFTKSITAAKLGDYATATACLDDWDKRFLPMEAVIAVLEKAFDDVDDLKGGSVDALADLLLDIVRDGMDDVEADRLPDAVKAGETANEKCPQLEAYRDALNAAENDLTTGTKMYDAALSQIRTDLVAAAETCAQGLDFLGGTALLLKVPAEAALARTMYTNGTAAAGTATAAKQAVATKGAALSVGDVRALLVPLTTHVEKDALVEQIKAIETKIVEAETAILVPDLGKAATALTAAADLAAAAMLEAENRARLRAAVDGLTARWNLIDAAAAAEKADVKTNFLDTGATITTLANIDANLKLLSEGLVACAAADEVARLSKAYDAALLTAQTDIGKLTDPFAVPDKAEVQAQLDDAANEATARDFAAALDHLRPVAEMVALALKIVAEEVIWLTLSSEVSTEWENGKNRLAAAATQPADLTTERDEIDTGVLDAAFATHDNRPTGEPGLLEMKAANKAMTDAKPRAEKFALDAWCHQDADTDRLAAESAIATLKLHPGKAALATEIAALDGLMTNAATLMSGAAYTAAGLTYANIPAECTNCTRIAAAAAAYDLALTAAQQRVATCKLAVDGVSPTSPGIVQVFATLQDETVAAAVKLAATRDHAAATKLLGTVAGRCTTTETLTADHGRFAAALGVAEPEVAKLTAPPVLAEAVRIGGTLIDPAKAAAVRLDFKTALELLGKVDAACKAAAAIVAGEAATEAELKTAGPALAGALPEGIGALEKLLAPLLVAPTAALIADLTKPISDALTAAKSPAPPPDASAQLTQAAGLCPPARRAFEQHAAFARALEAAETAATDLAAPLVAADRDAVRVGPIAAAKALVAPDKRDFAGAMTLLDAAMAACATAAAIVTRDTAFQLLLQKAKDALTAVNAPTTGPISVAAAALKTNRIDAADTLAKLPKRDHDAAEKLLAGFAAECKKLALRMKMEANTPPTATDITDLLAEPGGAKLLDDMVAALPDTMARAVLETAIALRFGLTSFKNLGAGGTAKDPTAGKSKTLKQLYALLAMVPDAHTLENASLGEVERYGGDSSLPANSERGSYFAGASKKVVLSCGRASDTDPQPLSGVALALPNVDPDCEMVPDSEVPAPKYFDWTTLHEVGHAIDDKKRFMSGKAGDGAFGGWQSHGRDVLPVVQAIGKACKYEGAAAAAYLAAYLSGGKPKPPPNTARSDWDACRQAAVKWCDEIRVGKELWENGGGASAHAVDGRVYHEAYANSWVSYDLSARSQGITGYQFRAPGEWLSELYAAYYCKKLKPSHPAASWLATL